MVDAGARRGLDLLRQALADVLATPPHPRLVLDGLVLDGPVSGAGWSPGPWFTGPRHRPLLSETIAHRPLDGDQPPPDGRGGSPGSADLSTRSAEGDRLVALVELARSGDADAFGGLFDHYHPMVYRYLYYRLGSVALAEDLTSETFLKALRSVGSFTWQGKDFGAWLMVIARNLAHDHFKSARARMELTTDDMSAHDSATDGPESTVLASLTNQTLLRGLRQLPADQQDCLVLRFLQDLTIAETAAVLDRSEGAVKQLQLRAVRSLAKLLPDEL